MGTAEGATATTAAPAADTGMNAETNAAACARVLLLRPLLGFFGFFPARPLAQPPLETAVAPSRWVPRGVFLVL